MKTKPLSLAVVALLAISGVWLAKTAWRNHASPKSSLDVTMKTPIVLNSDSNNTASLPKAYPMGSTLDSTNRPTPGQTLRPPDPARLFIDFTPEQRVEFARKGRGPGG